MNIISLNPTGHESIAESLRKAMDGKGTALAGTTPMACYPCLSSSKQRAVCIDKGGVDLIKQY